MHLSSRLPKKNYDYSLDENAGDRNAGGGNFKNQYHNTMGKKKSTERQKDKPRAQDSSPMNNNNSDRDSSSPNAVLKLPQINNQNVNSPSKLSARDQVTNSNLVKKSPYESMKPV